MFVVSKCEGCPKKLLRNFKKERMDDIFKSVFFLNCIRVQNCLSKKAYNSKKLYTYLTATSSLSNIGEPVHTFYCMH